MKNRYYGTGKSIENDAGYTVKVGDPVFDGTATANGSGQIYILGIKNDTQYLVTLEVNGEVKMYRELWKSGNTSTANEVPISDYTYVMDELMLNGLTEDDVVVARFEPCEVYTTDAFRAAVKKDAPATGGSGGDDNIFIVNATFGFDENDGFSVTLDKTYAEMAAAGEAGKTLFCVAWFGGYAYDVKPINYDVEGVFCTVDVNDGGGNMYEIGWYQNGNYDPAVDTALAWSKGGGSGGGVLVVTDTNGTLDKTWQEIHDAMLVGVVAINIEQYEMFVLVIGVSVDRGEYYVTGGGKSWVASSADGYPVSA